MVIKYLLHLASSFILYANDDKLITNFNLKNSIMQKNNRIRGIIQSSDLEFSLLLRHVKILRKCKITMNSYMFIICYYDILRDKLLVHHIFHIICFDLLRQEYIQGVMQRVNMIFFLINHCFLLAHPIWIVRVCSTALQFFPPR